MARRRRRRRPCRDAGPLDRESGQSMDGSACHWAPRNVRHVMEKKHGFTTRRWNLPRGRANEALDCRVYAYAALCGPYATRKLRLDRIADMIETIPAAERKAAVDAALPSPPPPAAPTAKPSRVHRSRWV